MVTEGLRIKVDHPPSIE